MVGASDGRESAENKDVGDEPSDSSLHVDKMVGASSVIAGMVSVASDVPHPYQIPIVFHFVSKHLRDIV